MGAFGDKHYNVSNIDSGLNEKEHWSLMDLHSKYICKATHGTS